MNLFFTADEHYGHENIIQYCKRPFSSTEAMRECLIARHNLKVPDSPDSVTIHLGDMFWRHLTVSECVNIVLRLNGIHFYLNGNHEEVFSRPDSQKLHAVFAGVDDVKMLKISNTKLIWLSHYAHRAWPKQEHGSYHLFGHSHGALGPQGRSMDVGVDANNFTPISFDEVYSRLKGAK